MTVNTMPESFVFMKIGNHAGETLDEIVARKRQELATAGRIFWGYGGSLLHPLTQVQPFAQIAGDPLHLLMEPMESRATPDILPATHMSTDGLTWEPLPQGVRVTGSRYALVLSDFEPCRLDFALGAYQVGVGRSTGRLAADYLQGHVDKGCFVHTGTNTGVDRGSRVIRFAARVASPYAVLLKYEPTP